MHQSVESRQNLRAGHELITIYREWHQFEKRIGQGKKGGGLDIVDIDVASLLDGFPEPFFKRDQVVGRLYQMQEAINRATPDGEYLYAKALSSLRFANFLTLGKRSNLAWETYVEQTMGCAPSAVPQRVISRRFAEIKDVFRDLGYKYTPEGWQQFLEQNALEPDLVEPGIEEAKRWVTPIMSEALGEEITSAYKVKYVNLDEPWINWISEGQPELLLRINCHPRNQARWFRGVTEMLAIHEIGGHFFMAEMFRRNIDAGLINPAYGIITVPGPEQIGLEGIAITLPEFIPTLKESLSDHGSFAVIYPRFQYLVENNAQLEFNGMNSRPLDKIVEDVRDYLPAESEERIKWKLELGRYNPIRRAYDWAYRIGNQTFMKIAGELSEQGCADFIKELYTRPRTPQQIKDLVSEVKASDLARAL